MLPLTTEWVQQARGIIFGDRGSNRITVSIEEAQQRLPELIAELQVGEQLVIDQNGAPVATLTRVPRASWPCQPGTAKHLPHWMAPDFAAPLEDFREYMLPGAGKQPE